MKFTTVSLILFLICINIFGKYTININPDSSKSSEALIKIFGDTGFQNSNYANPEFIAALSDVINDTSLICRSLVKFDLSSIPANAIIENAELYLYAVSSPLGNGHNKDASGNSFVIQKITEKWDATKVTWMSKPKTDTINQVKCYASSDPYQDYIIQIKDLLNSILNDSSNNGLMFRLENETGKNMVNFGSTKNSNRTKRPSIKIDYRLPVIEFEHTQYSFNESNHNQYIYIKFSDTIRNDVTVKLTYQNKTAKYGEDILFNASSIVIKAGKIKDSIPVKIIDDNYFEENDETIDILFVYALGAELGSQTTTEIKILKNDFDAINLNYGLSAYYPFENNTKDSLKKNNAIDSTHSIFINGINGKAIKVNGSSDYMYIPDFKNSDYSYSFWVYAEKNSTSPFGPIISAIDNNNNKAINIQIWDKKDTTIINRLDASFLIEGTDSIYEHITSYAYDSIDSAKANNDSIIFINPKLIEYEKWTHCLINIRNDEMQLYINGELVASKKRLFKQYSSIKSPLYIGRSKWTADTAYSYFKGKLDEIRIYNRGLTENEIRQLNSEGAIPKVSFVSSSSECLENGKFFNVPLKLSEKTYHEISVYFKVTGGSAKDTADFFITDTILTINPLQNDIFIPVFISDDLIYENDETIELTIISAEGGYLGDILKHTVTIRLNDIDTFNLNYGLVGYYPFENNVNDNSGNGNDGFDFGSGNYINGIKGIAKIFDGKNDIIQLKQTLDASKGLSFSFWIKTKGTGENENNGIIISKYFQNRNQSFYIKTFEKNENGIKNVLKAAFYTSDYSKYDFTGSDSASQIPVKPNVYPQEIEANKWSHCVVNLTEKTFDIYINNILVGSTERKYIDYFSNNEETFIGNSNWMGQGANNHFKGYLDELRIYNRPLSLSEIAALYDEGKNNINNIETSEKMLFSVYPNPASDKIFLKLYNDEIAVVTIYNILGEKIKHENILNNKEINISELESGIYILKVETNNFSQSKKIIVNNRVYVP
jgi:hypothetical protein